VPEWFALAPELPEDCWQLSLSLPAALLVLQVLSPQLDHPVR
jgi:hypothetical protein